MTTHAAPMPTQDVELRDVTLTVNAKLDAVRPSEGSAAWFEQLAQRNSIDIAKALDAISKADLRPSTLPKCAEVQAVCAALLLLLDASRSDDGLVDLSWEACLRLAHTTQWDVNNEGLAGLLAGCTEGELDLPASSWAKLRLLLARKSFSVPDLAAKHAGAALLAEWVLKAVAFHDLAVGHALAEAREAETGEEAAGRRQQAGEAEAELVASGLRLARLAAEVKAEVEAALPALEAARQALGLLNKKDVVEVKAYAKPPPAVEMVMEAVMVLRKQEPTWTEAKKQLGDANFLMQLVTYDKEQF